MHSSNLTRLSKMQKVFVYILFISLFITAMGFTCAEASSGITIFVNGEFLETEAAPVIIEDRTMVPMRAIFEALGATVTWDDETKRITGIRGGTHVVLFLEKKQALINGKFEYLEVPPMLINGRTMVPARFVAESLGAKVEWYNDARVVNINLAGVGPIPDVAVTSNEKKFSPAEIYSLASPAVLYIETYDGSGKPFKLGSAIIAEKNGKIITNYHIIEGATDAKVFLVDGRSFHISKVLNYNKEKDIAVLKINADNLPVISLGDSDALENGDKVVVIGSPLGLADTVSDGLISNKRRMIGGNHYIQTSAPISPGNSGGPLLNENAEAIGIMTLTILEGQNLNFAIPINEIKPYLSGNIGITLAELTRRETIKPPTELRAKALSSSEILISWNKVKGADYYYAYYSYSYNGPYYAFVDRFGRKTKIYTTSLTAYGVPRGTTSYYKVTAVKDGIESDYSKAVSATTFRSVPIL